MYSMWYSWTWWWITLLWLLRSVENLPWLRLYLSSSSSSAYHMDCLKPPLNEPPPGAWYCQLCVWWTVKCDLKLAQHETCFLRNSVFYIYFFFSSSSPVHSVCFVITMCDNDGFIRFWFDSCRCLFVFIDLSDRINSFFFASSCF